MITLFPTQNCAQAREGAKRPPMGMAGRSSCQVHELPFTTAAGATIHINPLLTQMFRARNKSERPL
jgi:hypothetical protein